MGAVEGAVFPPWGGRPAQLTHLEAIVGARSFTEKA